MTGYLVKIITNLWRSRDAETKQKVMDYVISMEWDADAYIYTVAKGVVKLLDNRL